MRGGPVAEVLGYKVPESVDDPEALIESLCGAFKVPTLRNVEKTAPNMHNGRFETLHEVVSFYLTRDTNPEDWYPCDSSRTPLKFDDLPSQYHDNVNTGEPPYDRQPGEAPRLSPSEVDDVVAFLLTSRPGSSRVQARPRQARLA